MHRAAGSAVALLTVLTGCGTPLLIQRFDVTLSTPDGQDHPAELDYRFPKPAIPSDGDATLGDFLLGVLMEPFDILVSTGIAVDALGTSRTEVVGGPLGWLASLTPFATLVPDLEFGPRSTLAADPVLVESLQSEDAEVRRAALHTTDWGDAIVDVRVRAPAAR